MANERLKEENQQRVLEKAIELCAEKGIEQMNISQVAKEAHVSIRSFYRYYDCKDDLIIKVVEVATERLKDALMITMKQKEFSELDGANKVIELCRTMLNYARDNCKLQSKLQAAESYLCEIGVPDIFSLFDTTDNLVTQWFVKAFNAGVEDGSIPATLMADEHNFRIIAVIYRGFYGRVAMISADEAMSSHYDVNILIEDYLKIVYKLITQQL